MIENKVTEIVIEALGLEDEEVTLESNLIDDLAAESIDFVDIAFNLEKEFGFKVNPGDIFPAFFVQGKTFGEDGKLLAELKERLSNEYPHINKDQIAAFESNKNAGAFMAVETIVNFVKNKNN